MAATDHRVASPVKMARENHDFVRNIAEVHVQPDRRIRYQGSNFQDGDALSEYFSFFCSKLSPKPLNDNCTVGLHTT